MTFIGLAVIVILVITGGRGEAWSYEADLSENDFLCFEVQLDSVHKRLILTFDDGLNIDVYDPKGRWIRVNHTSEFNFTTKIYKFGVNFVPQDVGKYTILVNSIQRGQRFNGKCNFDLQETSTKWKTTITEGDWFDYEIEVKDPNKPIVIYVKYGGTYNQFQTVLFDPSMKEIKHELWLPGMTNYIENRSYHVYPIKRSGTYMFSIEGSRILLPEGGEFEARCNYPITGPGIPVTIMGMTFTTIFILILLVVLVVVSLVVVRRQMRKRQERALEWKPVTDISQFEQPSRATIPPQRDFSYLGIHSRRRRRWRDKPPRTARPDNVAVPPPDTAIARPSPPPPPPPLPSSTPGMDGYRLPPPPPTTPKASPVLQAPSATASTPVPTHQPTTPTPTPSPTQPRSTSNIHYPKCPRCGNIILANHPVCTRCGSPR